MNGPVPGHGGRTEGLGCDAVEPSSLRAIYLTGPSVYLRAPVDGDKEHAAAWLDDTFPVNAPAAESALKEEYGKPWWDRSGLRLMLVRREGDAIVGGIRIRWRSGARLCQVEFVIAPWEQDGDSLRAEALRIAVPWLRDEIEAMVVGTTLAADQTETVRAAEDVGMERHAMLREWFTRPGGRADALVYEALNPNWVVRDA